MNNEYLTVQAFAEAVGISNQAVYQQLNKKLKPYYKLIDNKKMIDTRAIQEVYSKQVDTIKQATVEANNQQLINELKEHIQDLQEQLAVAKADKEVKDKQIAELNERLKEANALNKNNQILIGIQQDPALPEPESNTEQPQPLAAQPKKVSLKSRIKYFIKGELDNG